MICYWTGSVLNTPISNSGFVFILMDFYLFYFYINIYVSLKLLKYHSRLNSTIKKTITKKSFHIISLPLTPFDGKIVHFSIGLRITRLER